MRPFRSNAERTIGRVVESKAMIHGSRPFLLFEDEQHSYVDLHERSNRVAHALKALGVKKGDRVATILPNYPEYFYVWWAIHKLGAWEVPINGSYRGASLADVVNRSDARLVLVADGLFLDRLEEVQSNLLSIEQVVVAHRLSAPSPPDPHLRWSSCNLAELMTYSGDSLDEAVFHYDPCMIAYTSGTTGPPKGVVLTHEFIIHNCENKIRHMGTTARDIIYNCFPMYNLTGQGETTLTALIADAKVAMAERFDAANFWNDIEKYRCTEFVSMGGAFALVEKQPPLPSDGNSTLERIYIIPLDVAFQERCEKRFNVKMMEVYGQTECGVTNYRTWNDGRMGSCGRANSGYEVKIFDDNDEECRPGVEGEIVVRPMKSHIMVTEYYKMPEKLGTRMRNCWWHTGDVGTMDEDGYLFFKRRKEESIRFRGNFVSTTELERVVGNHPAVLECVAYRVPDEIGQEHDVAIAVKVRSGCEVTAEELLAHCEQDLPFYMVPCYVRWMEDFEKTPTMRIVKSRLEEDGITPDMWSRRRAGYRLRRG